MLWRHLQLLDLWSPHDLVSEIPLLVRQQVKKSIMYALVHDTCPSASKGNAQHPVARGHVVTLATD
jgi:hypothetical protein